MDTTVSGIGAVVVAELRAAGYMESTVGQYGKTIKALTEFASGREYSAGLGAEFASMTTSARTGRFSPQRRFDYRRLVAVFDSYAQTGRVDLAVRGRGGGGPRPEGSDFVALDAAWEAEMGRRGLALATREAYGRSPEPTNPIGAATLWWIALLDRDQYLAELKALTWHPPAWGDYERAYQLLDGAGMMQFVEPCPDDDSIAYVKFMPNVDHPMQAFAEAAVPNAKVLTMVRCDDGLWRAWGLSDNSYFPSADEVRGTS